MPHRVPSHYPFLLTLRSKGLSHSKMKWWAIYTNLPVNTIVRLPHPWGRDSQGQETLLAISADKQTLHVKMAAHLLRLSFSAKNHLSVYLKSNTQYNCHCQFFIFLFFFCHTFPGFLYRKKLDMVDSTTKFNSSWNCHIADAECWHLNLQDGCWFPDLLGS